MSPTEISTWAASQWAALGFTPLHLVVCAAGVLAVVFAAAGAPVRTMLPLRWLAVGSNLGSLVPT